MCIELEACNNAFRFRYQWPLLQRMIEKKSTKLFVPFFHWNSSVKDATGIKVIFLRTQYDITDGLKRKRCNSIANWLDSHLFCIKPSIYLHSSVCYSFNHILPDNQEIIKALHYLPLCSQVTLLTNNEVRKRSPFHIVGPLWGESTGHQWIPFTKDQQCRPFMFLCCQPQQTGK